MKITNMKTNRINNPLGFTLDTPRVSWQIEEVKGIKQKNGKIEVAKEESFENLLFVEEDNHKVNSLGTMIPISLEECTRYYWRVTVTTDLDETLTSPVAWFETGCKEFKGEFITPDTKEEVNALYEKVYKLENQPIKARAYACGLGLYELYINEQKVGDEYLTPGFNDYDSWIQTQTYDITDIIQVGENKISALTGDGLYKGRFGFEGGKDKIYGDKQAFLCDIVLTYEDGAEKIISTGKDWKIKKSKVEFSDIYDGEIWNDTFEDVVSYPVSIANIDKGKLMPRLSLPVIEKELVKPIKLITSPSGEKILDMGQNMVGWVSFLCNEPAGTRVTLEYGEILQDGNFYNENLRVAKQQFVYTSDGNTKEVRPKFTFYGFRYVKLTGFTGKINLENFTGRVLYSDMDQTGRIETSNDKVNRLFSNALWGQKGNFVDVPTDCPQRDERMGWTGDAQVFCGTAAFNMDIYAFMKKYCHDMKLEQRKAGGRTPMVVPSVGMDGGGSSAWGDAATIVPWTVYEYYGDVGILEESYEGMKAWVEYIIKQDKESGDKRLWTTGFHFGDWLAMDGENPKFPTGGTEIAYISSCYYLMSTEIVAKAAKILGYKEEAANYGRWGKEIRKAIYREYFTPTGRLAMQNQTAYALALHCKLAPKDQLKRVAKDFHNRMKKDNGYLKTGFVGTPLLCRMLSDYGYNEMAYKLLLNEEMPSWLYCVNLDATTIWERWNSVMPDGSMNPEGMNSLNHYAYGSIVEWMYRNVAGINQQSPGFKRVRIAPMPDERIDWVKAHYNSTLGKVTSNWKHIEGGIEYFISIPFEMTGMIELQVEKKDKILVNGKSIEETNLTYSIDERILRIEIKTGDYQIKIKK